MGGFSKAILYGSITYFTLVLIKDGTLPKLVTTAANGGNQLIAGLKPITALS